MSQTVFSLSIFAGNLQILLCDIVVLEHVAPNLTIVSVLSNNVECGVCSTCDEGAWVCTLKECSKTCSVIGLQHVKTFDGKEYDIRGPATNFTMVEVQ